MMKYWLNVSYMVELICACLLFLKPVRKRKHFVLIATVLSISMLILVGFYNEFVGKPDSAKKTRGDQYLFVNNRFIKSPYLNHAVMTAFQDMIRNRS